jgi:hypothetical protein
MRPSVAVPVIALLALLPALAPSALAADLDEHLRFLEPLIGREWVGGYVGPGSGDLRIVLRFEPILDGCVVRYSREAEAAEFSAVTHFYWIPGRGQVRFLSLNNKRISEEGLVEVVDGSIVLRGKSYRPDRTVEFETTLAFTADGALRDTFRRLEGDARIVGHVQEFVATE